MARARSWSDRMSRPGRQFVTASQAEADEARRRSAELTRNSVLKQLDVLKLTKKRNQIQFQGVIDEAERQIDKAQEQLEKQLALDEVGVNIGEAVYLKELSRLREIEKEIDYCFIRAPRDGMVVYYVEERARWSSNQAGVIAQGESVKEGQKMLSIPDLKHMVVNARVHEAMVSRVIADVNKDTGFSDAINASLLISPKPLSGLSAYTTFLMDLRAPFSNDHRSAEKDLVSRGLEATIRVNAFPNRPLKGHVKSVAAVASQNDFFASNVKVYQTFIAVDETMEGLRPGMDAVVNILVDSSPEPVVQIPLQAVLGTADMGEKRRCYVMVDGQPQLREISLGMTNEKVVEVKDGLKEGEVVVMNPVVLLTEKERMEYGNLPAQSGRGGSGMPDGQGGQGGPGGYKGKKGGPGAGGPGMQGGPNGGMKGKRRGGGMQGGQGGPGPRSQSGGSSSGKTAANP